MLHLEDLLAGPPTPRAQAEALARLADALAPLRRAHGLPDFDLLPGLRLRRTWGRCVRPLLGRPRVLVRCTTDDRAVWRPLPAIVATLLHEMAHLRHAHHGPRFWSLNRALLDAAAVRGLYAPPAGAGVGDAASGGRGDEKLVGSAADSLARAARARRQAYAAANRAAARTWRVGEEGVVAVSRGPLRQARVRVLAVGRGRLTVEAADGRRYLVGASLLARAPLPVTG